MLKNRISKSINMGGCGCKCADEYLSEKFNIRRHDRCFLQKLDLSYLESLDKPDSLSTRSSVLIKSRIKSDLNLIKDIKNNCIWKIRPKMKSLLLIEIQEAKNLKSSSFGILKSCVYTQIELIPAKVIYYTKTASINLPIWYSLFEFSHNLNSVKKIKYKLIEITSCSNNNILGEGTIKYKNIDDGNVHSHWYYFEKLLKDTAVPGILIKTQVIKKPIEEYHNYIKYLYNTSDMLKSTYSKFISQSND
jgi:C2 domain